MLNIDAYYVYILDPSNMGGLSLLLMADQHNIEREGNQSPPEKSSTISKSLAVCDRSLHDSSPCVASDSNKCIIEKETDEVS